MVEMDGCDDELARVLPVLVGDGWNPGVAARVRTFAAKLGNKTEAVAVPGTSRLAQHELVRPDPITRGDVRARRPESRPHNGSESICTSSAGECHFRYVRHESSGDRTDRRPRCMSRPAPTRTPVGGHSVGPHGMRPDDLRSARSLWRRESATLALPSEAVYPPGNARRSIAGVQT